MKKTIAFVVLIAIIMSLSSFSVPFALAQYNETAIDDFEDGNLGEVKMNGSSAYYVSSAASGLFVQPSVNNYANHISIDPTKGYNGTTGLYIHCDQGTYSDSTYKGAWVKTKTFNLESTDSIVLRYKIKFISMPNPTQIYLSVLSQETAANTDSGVSYDRALALKHDNFSETDSSMYMLNKWYTVVTRVTASDSGKRNMNTYVLNEDNEVFKTLERKSLNLKDSDKFLFYPAYVVAANSTGHVKFVMDDVSVKTHSTASSQAIDVDPLGSNIKEGDKGVAINPVFDIAFDHDYAQGTEDTVTLYEKNDPSSAIALTASQKTFNSFKLTPASNLKLATDYVLDFGKITSSTGGLISENSSTINFKTYDPGDVALEPVKLDTEKTTLKEGATNVATDESFTLFFDREILSPTGGEDIKLYPKSDNTKTSVGLKLSDVAVNDGKSSITVSPENNLILNTEYILDFSGIVSNLGIEIDGIKMIGFKTMENRDAIFLSEDFENIDNGTSGDKMSGSVLLATSTDVVKNDVGFNSGKGFVANNSQYLQTKPIALDDSETMCVEFKAKLGEISGEFYIFFNEAGYDTHLMRIRSDNDNGNYYITDGYNREQYRYQYTPGEWFNFIIKINKQSQICYVYNMNGELVLETLSRSINKKYFNGSGSLFLGVMSKYTKAQIIFDDMKLYRAAQHTVTFEKLGDSLTNGMKDVITFPQQKLKVAFSQPMVKTLPENAVALYANGQEMAVKTEFIGGNEITIIPEEQLMEETEYTLQFSDSLLSLSALPLSEKSLSFTTKQIYPVAVSETTVALSDNRISQGTYGLKLNSKKAVKGNLIVGIYSSGRLKRLIGVTTLNNISVNEGTNNIEFTLNRDYEGVGKVEFLLYDSAEEFLPLMRNFKCEN